jgi:hypothetical protein
VLVEDPHERVVVGQIGQRKGTAVLDAVGPEAGLGIDVTAQRNDALAVVQKPFDEPAAEKSLRSCD